MGDTEHVERFLTEHPFFKNMAPAACTTVAECAANEHFNAGEYLVREGSLADKLYLLRHGNVALEVTVPRSETLIVETLQEGDVLGWPWFVSPYRWRIDARALYLVRAISLDAHCLRAKCERDHTLGFELLKRFIPVITSRLEAGRFQLIDMYSKRSLGGHQTKGRHQPLT
jgi:CRP-like cAMP-binding protein